MPPTHAIALDLRASSIELTQALCDIESVSGDEKAIADRGVAIGGVASRAVPGW